MPIKAEDLEKLTEAFGKNKTMIEMSDVAEVLAEHIREGRVRAALILVEFHDGGRVHHAAVEEESPIRLFNKDYGGGGAPLS